MRRKLMVRTAITFIRLFAAAAMPGSAFAAPGNDAFASATVIDATALPFSDQVDIGTATFEGGEPQYCYFASQTVWYAITPSTTKVLRVSASGSSFSDTILNVYRQTGSGFGGLSNLMCQTFGTTATFTAEGGTTYYVQAGKINGGPGTMNIGVQEIPPPANDNFASATAVGGLPYADTVDATPATNEAGEPTPSCSYTGQPAGTVWYRYTAPSSGSISVTTFGSYATTVFAAYSGSTLGSLAEIACRVQYGRLTIPVQAGQTYSFLVGGLYGVRGAISFQLDVAPQPVASFGMSAGDPSIFDTIQFYNSSYDPGEIGIQSWSWSFGDGASSTAQSPQHRFAVDGDYDVRLSVTTADGRTASQTQAVHVRTHDIAIAKVGVPQTGTVGQSRQITVGLVNTRYAENVQVVLYKSVAGGGWQQVGALTQWVPVRGPSRTTNFAFSYTFAPEDAVLGKITFQAVAVIQGARDAISTDNSYISLSTKVNG
jgi:hypothetical protein